MNTKSTRGRRRIFIANRDVEFDRSTFSSADFLRAKIKATPSTNNDGARPSPASPARRVPSIGINVAATGIHIVLLELYPQNVDHSTITFQRYLVSLMLDNEHENWSILNVPLHTRTEQEGNFRLFTLTHVEFDSLLVQLQNFIRFNSSIASSFLLNIALTGEQTDDYESRISSRLSKINLNFDLIQYRAESYMIGFEFFLGKANRMAAASESLNDELIDVLKSHRPTKREAREMYPYLLIHAEAASTFFYVVHSPSQYAVVSSNNLCYKTYWNLMKLLQPGFDPRQDDGR